MPEPISLLQPVRPDSLQAVHVLLNKARQDGVSYFPSPADWRDEILYFLLPDRFSDGQEHNRPLLSRDQILQLRKTESQPGMNWSKWAESGSRWQGGTIKGIEGRLSYLQQLGITAVWIAPLFKQRVKKDTFHGYGIQDFLEIDPRFGTRKDLIELVQAAHARKIKVILDVIINHSGDNWGYTAPGAPINSETDKPGYQPFPHYYGDPHDTRLKDWKQAWRNAAEQIFSADAGQLAADDGVWPKELQHFTSYTRAGKGSLGDNDLQNDHAEHKRTDFETLKDFALDQGGTLGFLCDCFKYWIALTDCDGFRIDTVKHISLEEARNFCGSMLEFAESLGKRNFLLVGEIAGGDGNQDFVMDYMALVQRNLRAALDIGSDRVLLGNTGKGLSKAEEYFNGFAEESKGFGSHRSFGGRHVSILDDHDHVSGEKLRFSARIPDTSPVKDYQVVVPTAIQLFSLGIPCIYYGSEQAFSGPAASQLRYMPGWGSSDRYLREAMFGPEHPRQSHLADMNAQLSEQDQSLPGFGAFGTAGKHIFDQNSPSYLRMAALCKVRSAYLVLRTGRQYLRQVRVNGGFEFPPAGELVAWSRILDTQEAVCIINPNGAADGVKGGDVVVASESWQADTVFKVVANSAEAVAPAGGYKGSHPVHTTVKVTGKANGEPAYIRIRDVQPAEVLVLIKVWP